MTSVYDELSSLFGRFYSRRGESGGILFISVGACHAGLQTLFVISLLLVADWLGIACVDVQREYAIALSIVLPASALNYLLFRSPDRRAAVIAPLGGPLPLGKAALGFSIGLIVASILLYRGSVPGIPARLDLVLVCAR